MCINKRRSRWRSSPKNTEKKLRNAAEESSSSRAGCSREGCSTVQSQQRLSCSRGGAEAFSLLLRLSISAADAAAATATVNAVAAAAAGGVVVDGAINSSFIPFWQRPTPTETATSQKKKKTQQQQQSTNSNPKCLQRSRLQRATAAQQSSSSSSSRGSSSSQSVRMADVQWFSIAWLGRPCHSFQHMLHMQEEAISDSREFVACHLPLSFSHSLCFSFILPACLYPATTQCALEYPYCVCVYVCVWAAASRLNH